MARQGAMLARTGGLATSERVHRVLGSSGALAGTTAASGPALGDARGKGRDVGVDKCGRLRSGGGGGGGSGGGVSGSGCGGGGDGGGSGSGGWLARGSGWRGTRRAVIDTGRVT